MTARRTRKEFVYDPSLAFRPSRRRTRSRPDAADPADPFVVRAFLDICLCKRTELHRPSKLPTARALERQSWIDLMNYLLEQPQVR